MPRTAWLELDLDALAGNLQAIRAAVGPKVRVEPVVKADAYGHGAVPIARALEAAGADGFSVAAFDEAVALRLAGIRAPILVLYPVPPEHAVEAARRGIALTAGPGPLLDRLLDRFTAERPSRSRPLHLQLEVETGLGRGGLLPDDLGGAVERIAATPGIRLDGAWSHLAAPADSRRTTDQQSRFDAALRGLADGGVAVGFRHLAGSGGILGDVGRYDAVRPGLAIYGLVPGGLESGSGLESGGGLAARLRPVLSLHARPVRVADLPAGHGVSYGPSFETRRPSRIATLPLGYGDGWPRSLSNRAEALVRGDRCPLVGTVSMDAVMADVTAIPGPPVTTDDEFVLIGEQGGGRITAEDVAQSRNTISYEVVTGMSGRLPRVYHAAAGARETRTLVVGGGVLWQGSSSGTASRRRAEPRG